MTMLQRPPAAPPALRLDLAVRRYYPRADAPAGPIVLADRRGGHFLGLEFRSIEAAHAWIDAADDDTFAELLRGGFRPRPMEGGAR